uniref:F-box domain-containing protein n=1 Tax=Chenopodium quinoa TaxID=63459 RepID=A0A803LXG5_CHEQI
MEPALKSCKHKCSEVKGGEFIAENDRMSQLPHDVLMTIMSLLTMKEAGKTSIVSHTWYNLWRCLPVLFFKVDPYSTIKDKLLLPEQRSGFTGWVNSVVGAHLGPVIDELRVIFDLDVRLESDIDKWVIFGFSKQVKHLELDLTPFYNRSISLIDCYTWPLDCRISSLALLGNMTFLRSLCLKYVNVSGKDVECLLRVCYALEDLCIVNGSIDWTHINLPDLSLQLKHLKVLDCPRLMSIDIKVPKLVSFTHHWRPIDLHIRDSLLLSKVSIGNGEFQGEIVNHVLNSLSTCFSNVKFMSWDFMLDHPFVDNLVKVNMGINNPPCMTNLKHMEFHFSILYNMNTEFRRDIVKHKGRPLKSLKTLEHIGILGLPIDIEFATYVVENSIMLKDIGDYLPFIAEAIVRRRSRSQG